MSFTRLASGKILSLHFGFHTLLHQKYYVWLFAVKGEKFCPFQDIQGLQPKFKDFSGPGIFFCQLQAFPGFQGPWQPCF